MTLEVNSTNMNAALVAIENSMKAEVEKFGDNADVALSMSLMTYLCASMLIGYKHVCSLSAEQMLVDHLKALKAAILQLNIDVSDVNMH